MLEIFCLISIYPNNPSVVSHLANNGYAVFLDNALQPIIKFYKGSTLIGEIKASDIPASLNGTFKPTMHNAMFAIGMAWGMGIKFDVIRDALKCFVSNELTNPGRMNFFDHLPFKLLITFADGPEAVYELTEYIKKQYIFGNKILMISGSGDRPDSFLQKTGEVAASGFDKFICTEYDDLRGRAHLEAPKLVAQGLLAHKVNPENIIIAPSHDEALRLAFQLVAEGDFLVIESYYGLKAKALGLLECKS